MALVFIDTSEAIRRFRKVHAELSEAQFQKQVVRALNHTINKTKTATSREIRSVYGARAKEIKKSLRIKRANLIDPSAGVIASGKPLPLIGFRARQNKRGVSVRIKGKRRIVHKAFIATMNSGHTGVFARGHYSSKGKFLFRYKRVRQVGKDLPINELFTTSVPRAMVEGEILSKLSNQMKRDFPARLSHLLRRASR